MNSMKRKKDMTLKDELPRLVGEEWRNSSRRNKEAEPKQKQCSGVDVCLVVKVKSDAAKNNTA